PLDRLRPRISLSTSSFDPRLPLLLAYHYDPLGHLAAAFPFWLPPSWRAFASFSPSASLLRAQRSGSAEATRSRHNWSTAYQPHRLLTNNQ
ncbi:hypothetical protein D6D06_04814, partial [Aureobasidium pullulans]